MSHLSAKTRVNILKMIATKERTHKEIGEVFNVSTKVVSNLSSSLKQSKSSIVKRRI